MISFRLLRLVGQLLVCLVGAGAVVAAPTITLPPQSATAVAGSSATFTVVASGTGALHYDWRRDGTSLGAPDTASYTAAVVALADSGAAFTVSVSDGTGAKVSLPAFLTVNPAAPRVFADWASAITDPAQRGPGATPLGDGVPNLVKYAVGLGADQRPAAGDLPVLASAAGGNVFRFERARAATGLTATPEKSTTLSSGSWVAVPATKVADDGVSETWEVVVSGSDSRAFYRLNVAANSDVAPALGTQPAGAAVALGGTTTFTVAAAGTGPFTYQWRKNGVAIAGATGASYTPPAATGADHGARFSVLVTGPAGTVASVDAALAVSAVASTTYTPLAQLPALAGGPGLRWTASNDVIVKDRVGGDLIGFFAGAPAAPATNVIAVISRDDGQTWSYVQPTPAFGLPGATCLCQSDDGKIHVLGVLADGLSYARLTLVRDAQGHVTNFTSDLTPVTPGNNPKLLLPASVVAEVRPGLIAGRDQAGNPRLFWIAYDDGASSGHRGRVIAGMTSVAAGWSPTSASDWVSLTNTTGSTVLKEGTSVATNSPYYNSAHIAQHPASRDLWIEWGPINTDDSAATNTNPLQRLRCTPSGPSAWSIGTPVDAGVFNSTLNWQCLLGSIAVSSNAVWFTRVDGGTGIHVDRADQNGAVTVDALPVAWGGTKCGAYQAFGVSADGGQAWLGVWSPLDSLYQTRTFCALHWDGAAWTRYDDLDVADTAGMSQSTGWNNGLVIVAPVWGGDWRLRVATIRSTGSALSLPPVIVTPPAATAVLAGRSATFNVTAVGTAPLHYQWRRNGTAVAGAPDAASYTTPVTTLADNGASYSAVVTNVLGGEVSRPATLTVTAPPPAPVINSFTAAPATINLGQSTTLSWVVTGADSLSLDPALGALSGNSVSASPTANTTYTLTATNAAGSVTATTTVTVNGGNVPTLGAHKLATDDEYLGHDPIVTAPVTTHVGSTLLAISLQSVNNPAAPTDNYANTWTPLGPKHYYAPPSDPWYHAVWAATNAKGGSGHTLSVAKPGYPASEATLELLEVLNSSKVGSYVYAWNGVGPQHTTPAVTTHGPAVLVAIWTGGGWFLEHTAVPDNGFTVIDAYLMLGGTSGIQVAVAVKQVLQAGTYTTTWTATPTQDAGCFLIAIE